VIIEDRLIEKLYIVLSGRLKTVKIVKE